MEKVIGSIIIMVVFIIPLSIILIMKAVKGLLKRIRIKIRHIVFHSYRTQSLHREHEDVKRTQELILDELGKNVSDDARLVNKEEK